AELAAQKYRERADKAEKRAEAADKRADEYLKILKAHGLA
ncbi:MAG: Uma2 family endonuclease, partial [Fibrobacteraceae bacterium]|nr:Uma2 family endonuclease [Fibrobacteraceae bacterium]MCF0217159.1 Uma2 family endonuclease [Fibrobacteraceae bacterium]